MLGTEIAAFFLRLAAAVVGQAGTGRDQATDDDVLLQAAQSSRLPMIAASVSTRVVSWKEAAEMKESVDSEALVMPSSTFSYCAGSLPSASDAIVLVQHLGALDLLLADEPGVAGSVMTTRRSIWRTITSMCLSLIFTPCRR